MLTIRTIPHLMRIMSKVELQPIIEKLKGADIFEEAKDKEDAVAQLSREKLGMLAFEVITEIIPQIERFAGDVIPFVAAYRDVSIQEAEALDAEEIIHEIMEDKGIINFFTSVLRKSVGQKH